ncbi:DNA mismatch repair protein MutS, partial [bacterium]|nr:DNA mismatch repair protein MutS [bacterium]
MTDNSRKITPMMRQYNELKARHPDAILFFRMGDFYEMFGEDAVKAAPVLDVVLTSRDKNSENKVPMCGIPYHAVDTYIARLIENNMKVAICEQLEDARQAKGIVRRGVVRLITPGTILEANLLSAKENNFIASVYCGRNRSGLAFLDMSTGEFMVTEIDDESVVGDLIVELERWSVREVIHPESLNDLKSIGAFRLSSQEDWVYTADYAEEQIRELFKVTHLDGLGLAEMPDAVIAVGALINYIRGTHIETLGHITGIQTYHNKSIVHLDSSSRRNLEITRTLMGNQREGSLLHYLDETVTPMGSRVLKQRIEQPLRDIEAINHRLDLVEGFYEETGLRFSIRDQLAGIADLERLVSRIATGIANPRDLAVLRNSLQQLPSLKLKLQNSTSKAIEQLGSTIDPIDSAREFLEMVLADEPPASLKDGGIIRTGYEPELDQLREASRDGKKWISSLQNQERNLTGITSLKVRYNKVFGYFIDVTKSNLDKIPDRYIRRQTLVNSERYVTPELKEMEDKILGAEEKMIALEQELFRKIRQEIGQEVVRIQSTARTIASIDIAASSAESAVNYRYRRPLINDENLLEIQNGRHPVVERIPTERGFVPNDTKLDSDGTRLVILTNPNITE